LFGNCGTGNGLATDAESQFSATAIRKGDQIANQIMPMHIVQGIELQHANKRRITKLAAEADRERITVDVREI
jgi:hypothetical protein